MSRFTIDTSAFMGAAPAVHAPKRSRIITPREPGQSDCGKWAVLAQTRRWYNQDIDWYRARYGKAAGEDRFFREHPEPDEMTIVPGNMVMSNGVAALWAYAMGLGTSTANTALQGATYYNSSNTYLYVGDGGPSVGSGTVSVTNAGTTVTFGTSQSGLQGKYLTFTGDSTYGFYLVTSGSGTSWTIATGYGGTTLSGSSAGWYTFTAESHGQTALAAGTNYYGQVADSGYPANAYSAQMNAISAATNASPIVLTVSGADINTNDIVQVFEVYGNTNANGIWVANPASSSSITLLNSSGNAAYTFGGYVTKRTVFSVQATFGSSVGNFAWNEWGVFNGDSTNKIMLNRKVTSLGTKTGGTTALKVGIGIG